MADRSPAFPACLDALASVWRKLRAGRLVVRVPGPEGRLRVSKGAHFHLLPEWFLQLGGVTDFRFPESNFRLFPGELCLVPRGVPHGEIARPWRGAFTNLVLMFSSDQVRFHFTMAGRDLRPRGNGQGGGVTMPTLRLVECLDGAAEQYQRGGPRGLAAARGLLLGHLAYVMDALENGGEPHGTEHPRITHCRQLVAVHLTEADLTVARLAEWLQCAPDYLSHFFRRETGVALKGYIAQKRAEFAKDLLRETPLRIKEIARACGYHRPGYFIRAFRAVEGRTPNSYRRDHAADGGA